MVPPHMESRLVESTEIPHILYPAIPRPTATPGHIGKDHTQVIHYNLSVTAKI